MKRTPETPLNVPILNCDFCMNPMKREDAVPGTGETSFCNVKCRTDHAVMTELQEELRKWH
jgi:hypothetical protein